jgi:activating signal cointegrator complex subunit 2
MGSAAAAAAAAAQRSMQGMSLQPQPPPQQAPPGLQPGGAGPSQQQRPQQPQQQQQRGPKAKGSKLWVLDGRIYNYAKAGAQEVSGREEADAQLAAAQQAAHAIMGLGPGGNKPQRAPQQESGGTGGEGGGDAGGRGGGRGRGGGGRGRGPEKRYKDQHKAGIANHHRKDRATAKQGRGMF